MTWCRLAGVAPLPAAPATVATYLSRLGERLSAGALSRRAAAIAAQHRQHGLASPSSDQAVTTLLQHARRTATRRRALPPTMARLTRMATACPGDLAVCAIGLCYCCRPPGSAVPRWSASMSSGSTSWEPASTSSSTVNPGPNAPSPSGARRVPRRLSGARAEGLDGVHR